MAGTALLHETWKYLFRSVWAEIGIVQCVAARTIMPREQCSSSIVLKIPTIRTRYDIIITKCVLEIDSSIVGHAVLIIRHTHA